MMSFQSKRRRMYPVAGTALVASILLLLLLLAVMVYQNTTSTTLQDARQLIELMDLNLQSSYWNEIQDKISNTTIATMAIETDAYNGPKQEKREGQSNHKSDDFTSSSNTNNTSKKNEKEPMNILLLYGDDWTLKTLGVLNKAVQTPHLDNLARNGILFTHNCVTTSICMISRATLYTGQYASRHETYLPTSRNMYASWNVTLWSLLKQHGYYTGMVGKWHHPPPPAETFDHYESYQGAHYIKRNNVTKHVTVWNEQDAMRFLDTRPTDKTFALMVSFFAIHAEDFGTEKYRPQQSSMQLYAATNDTIPTPKTATARHFQELPYFFRNGRNFGRGRWKNRYDTPELYQKMMKNMYRMATEVDQTCGRILNKLKEQGVLDNTLVIFTTDNGNLHGEHGLAEKWFPFEESIRVPLIIRDPRMPENRVGTTNDVFTLNIDLAPTILSAANIPVPKVMQGRDIADLYLARENLPKLSSSKRAWRDEFYYEWFTGDKEDIPASLALVRKDAKYIVWPEWDAYEQLFRLDHDPLEEYDLVHQVSSNLTTDQTLLESMRQRMAELKSLAKAGVPM